MSIGTSLQIALSVTEAAAALGIGRATLYELIKNHDAPPSYFVGRRRLFPIAGLEQWAKDRVTVQGNGNGDGQ